MNLKGYLAYDDANKGKQPGVFVVHEWWGLNETIRKRVDQLAAMGYVAFAPDLYGMGKTTTDMTKATKMLRMVQMNGYRWHQRGLVGLEVLRGLPQVDPQRISAIGYGWGGATLQQLVLTGDQTSRARCFSVRSRTACRSSDAGEGKDPRSTGDGRPLSRPSILTDYIGAMDKSGLNWQMVLYGGAKHGFSDPNAAQYKMEEFAYNEAADRQSWDQVTLFLENLFPR